MSRRAGMRLAIVLAVAVMLAAGCRSNASDQSDLTSNTSTTSTAAPATTSGTGASGTTDAPSTSKLARAVYGCSNLTADNEVFVNHLKAVVNDGEYPTDDPRFEEKATPLIGAAMAQCGVPWALQIAGEQAGDTRRALETIIAATAPTTSTVTVPAPPPSSAPPSPPPSPAHPIPMTMFTSPSGNIACLLQDDGARCDIQNYSWVAPYDPSCPLDYGDAITVDASGASFTCHGDTVFGSSDVLDYGSTARQGSYVCESRTTGMTCRSLDTGHGFSLAVEGYELF